jgi:hypothetical protein
MGWTVTGINAADVVAGQFTMPGNDVVFTAVWEKIKGQEVPPTGDAFAATSLISSALLGFMMTGAGLLRKKYEL